MPPTIAADEMITNKINFQRPAGVAVGFTAVGVFTNVRQFLSDKLLQRPRRSRPIDYSDSDITTLETLRALQNAGALDFWNHPDEDVYSLEDGEPV
jgi:hypothetical protein